MNGKCFSSSVLQLLRWNVLLDVLRTELLFRLSQKMLKRRNRSWLFQHLLSHTALFYFFNSIKIWQKTFREQALGIFRNHRRWCRYLQERLNDWQNDWRSMISVSDSVSLCEWGKSEPQRWSCPSASHTTPWPPSVQHTQTCVIYFRQRSVKLDLLKYIIKKWQHFTFTKLTVQWEIHYSHIC